MFRLIQSFSKSEFLDKSDPNNNSLEAQLSSMFIYGVQAANACRENETVRFTEVDRDGLGKWFITYAEDTKAKVSEEEREAAWEKMLEEIGERYWRSRRS